MDNIKAAFDLIWTEQAWRHVISADDLSGMLNLRHLSLSRNPLKSLFSSDAGQVSLSALRTLDLSAVEMPRLDTNSFASFPNLQTLNLSFCGVVQMYGEGLQTGSTLQVVDMVGCPMTQFPRDLLSGLDRLSPCGQLQTVLRCNGFLKYISWRYLWMFFTSSFFGNLILKK